jgi:hypothetical protein
MLVEIDRNFFTYIVDNLDARSKRAVLIQEDPESMTEIVQLRIRQAILHQTYRKDNSLLFAIQTLLSANDSKPHPLYANPAL